MYVMFANSNTNANAKIKDEQRLIHIQILLQRQRQTQKIQIQKSWAVTRPLSCTSLTNTNMLLHSLPWS